MTVGVNNDNIQNPNENIKYFMIPLSNITEIFLNIIRLIRWNNKLGGRKYIFNNIFKK